MQFDLILQKLSVFAIPVIFAITLHEAAHGYVARHFGDMTAFRLGRISLNPLRHIDPVGTLLVPVLILLLSSANLLFGWAKPVPVNFNGLRNPKRDMFWVAAAGPGANLAMALGWAALFKIATLSGAPSDAFVNQVAQAGVVVNLVLMALNLLPILPLDGGRIAVSLLPDRAARAYARLEPFGFPILLVLLFTNLLGWVLYPMVGASLDLLNLMFQVRIT